MSARSGAVAAADAVLAAPFAESVAEDHARFIAATRRGGFALLEATGPPGEALVPQVREVVEKGP